MTCKGGNRRPRMSKLLIILRGYLIQQLKRKVFQGRSVLSWQLVAEELSWQAPAICGSMFGVFHHAP